MEFENPDKNTDEYTQETQVSDEFEIRDEQGKSVNIFSSGYLGIFKPIDGYFITPILIILNILVFALMAISGVHVLDPDGQALIDWGANFRPITLNGEWWRLFTSCFLHIGLWHLLFNMYALFYIGLLLERHLGKSRFLAAYIITGIAASTTSLWWNELTISAGASGAIFGMYGVFLALLTTQVLDKSIKQDQFLSIIAFVFYNLIYGLRPDSGIDNSAHIGGLVSGILVGYAFVPSLKQFHNKKLRLGTITILSVILIISSSWAYNSISDDIIIYNETMEKFEQLETEALHIILQEDITVEEIISKMETIGIPNWKESIQLFREMENLDLPESLQKSNSKILEYCQLRLKSFELIQRELIEDIDDYEDEINEYFERIDQILEELKEIHR